jgi:NAD(P)-dependent dehydrogenase (short-subunit alcohol dehydrogenase family)
MTSTPSTPLRASPSAPAWALILGASSGFGAACALELARAGWNIFGVHLDLRATLPNAKRIEADIKAMGRQAVFFNVNAADPAKRASTLDKMQQALDATTPPGTVNVLIHSLAFGTLKPFIANNPEDAVSQAQIEMTLDVMANCLVYWTQDLVRRKMMVEGGRIFAMSSSGSHSVVPNYGAVSAAKAALESHNRQLALELIPYGIAVNALQPGLTDTPALRKIPGHEVLYAEALKRHPDGKLTTPEDVAAVVVALASLKTTWLTGNSIRVDGGEDIIG